MYDAVIIGGGAAGLFCAIRAGRRGKRVLVIEHNAEVGRKIIISGGGRCNFTNIYTSHENFISRNPHFCKSALSQYGPGDFVDLVKRHRIAYFEKKLGQVFCSQTSRQIVELLLRECQDARVEIKTGCTVGAISKDGIFLVDTSQGMLRSTSLIVACGGLSFPKVGATDLGYRIAKQFGLGIVDTRPSLVAMVFAEKGAASLAGISVDSVVSVGSNRFREDILFTHRGLSGPAILQASNYWKKGEPVVIDLLPDHDASDFAERAGKSFKNVETFLSSFLPQRLARNVLPGSFQQRRANDLGALDWEAIASKLKRWKVDFRETEGYGRAEVTLGGVSTHDLSSKTMEANSIPGLYFIGEVVDVTGWLGGYNFQWAWSSGFAAGTAL